MHVGRESCVIRAAAAQQHQTDTEIEAVRAVRASNATHSCLAHNGVAMGAQWAVREP